MANPFTPEDKKRVNEALATIAAVKKDIAKAKTAGIDVSEPEARLLATESKLAAIKKVYFPV